ncbi:MAG: Uma2 family endonuclease [Gammaproteobacteria bacterium]|nr:Uma2 family endonuclease [Gammaproteobacteria bacterium]
MGLARRDDERHTYGDYCTWSDNRRYELIDGIAYAMAGQLDQALRDGPSRLFVAPLDIRLPRHHEADDEIDTVVQSDWIVEILSPFTAAHDQVVKRALYEGHGVREYWLVHPTDRSVTRYRLDQGRYGQPEVSELSGSTDIATLPGVANVWTAVLRRL